MADTRRQWITFIAELQDRITSSLENEDGRAAFHEDSWVREEGGGGRTRIMVGGAIFEKGGVNMSTVFGALTEGLRTQLKLDDHYPATGWFACGLSLVLHPVNPHVPTVHCNYRMFELENAAGEALDRWFGGGTDLTPYYLVPEDVQHFHQTYKSICDRYDPSWYPLFKEACDNYFVNWHRQAERRGVGGIFYDYQRPDHNHSLEHWLAFSRDCGEGFLDAYVPLVQRNKYQPFTDQEKYWQEIRRGRYVEFNLVHDRGTLFGLKTQGRIESILMSLPPVVRFDYNFVPAPDSPEYRLWQTCLHPQTWA